MSDYSKMKNAELEALLRERSLPHTGKKADMVARLQENDKASQSAPAPAANEDEIDWDDDAAPAVETAPPAPAAVESAGEGNNTAAVPNQVPAIDPSTTEDLTVAPPVTTDAAASTENGDAKATEATAVVEEKKEEMDYSMGLETTDLEAEIAKRKARAAKFGIKEGEEDPDALEAIKKLERAKKFNEQDGAIDKLDGALPDRREKRRRGEGDDRNGDFKRRGGRGGNRNFGGRRGGDRGPRRDGGGDRRRDDRSGGGGGWMGESDRRAADARKNRWN
ncbi:SAP domain-containing protein [Venturia nashicola]|uniref:SAP domain-containing protein n=1 Tax=Venturia nashicola TaxID=86259 RepID=A0A4Z1PKH7_9PEZI|nr:SAP domain-containing protein [Venturia nashicola]